MVLSLTIVILYEPNSCLLRSGLSTASLRSQLQQITLILYWLVAVLDVIFLYFDLPYVTITATLLIPLLLLYILLNDDNIANPPAKLFFYGGLFLAFLGDVCQLVIQNPLFFISSLVAFMLMNICYSIAFYNLNRKGLKRPFPFLLTSLLLVIMGYVFLQILGDRVSGSYSLPLIIYMATLIAMAALVINAANSEVNYGVVVRYLLPGVLIFIIQNLIFAWNLFGAGGHSQGFVYSIIPYSIAQFLLAKGILKLYLKQRQVSK